MDRPCFFRSRRLPAVAVLAAVALSSGCRSTRSEVPPAKPFARTGTGDQPPSVGFSSQPHPANAGGMPASVNIGPGGMTDDRLAGSGKSAEPLYGTPTRGSKGIDLPTGNSYGPPGTSGLDPTAGAGSAEIANSLMDTGQSVSKGLADDPKLKKAAAMAPGGF